MPRLGRSHPAGAYLFTGRQRQQQGAAHTATASLTVTPSFSAARTAAYVRHASLTVTPQFSVTRKGGADKYLSGSPVPALMVATGGAAG